MHCQLTPNVFSFQYKIEKRANSDDEEEDEDDDDMEFGGAKKKQEEVEEDPIMREFIEDILQLNHDETVKSMHESHDISFHGSH